MPSRPTSCVIIALIEYNLRGRVKFPIGGTAREQNAILSEAKNLQDNLGDPSLHSHRPGVFREGDTKHDTGEIPEPTVTVWIEEG